MLPCQLIVLIILIILDNHVNQYILCFQYIMATCCKTSNESNDYGIPTKKTINRLINFFVV